MLGTAFASHLSRDNTHGYTIENIEMCRIRVKDNTQDQQDFKK